MRINPFPSKPINTFSYLLLFVGAMLVLAQACNYTQRITDGNTAWELKRYAEALPLLTKEYNKTSSRVEQGQLAYKIGSSYDNLHEPADALEWYRRAYDYQYGPEALESYAEMLMQTEQYDKALEAYKELGFEIGSRYQFRRQMQAAEFAKEFDETQSRFKVDQADFNTDGSTYAPSFASEDMLFFTSDQGPTLEKGTEYAWTGRAYSDLYLLPLPGGDPQKLDDNVNGPYNEGTAAISPDGRHLVFTRCAPFGFETGYCQLFMSDREGDGWSEAQALTFQEPDINYVQPAWSADGSLLYFSSDHPDGYGGYDLYATERMPAMEWSTPKRLPRTINTPKDENFPSFDKDTLYFSSDGHGGVGGLDILRTYPIGSDGYATPFNLLPPVNSGADDFGISFSPKLNSEGRKQGYFSSSRGDGLDRIYAVEQLPPPPPPVPEIDPIDSTIIVKTPSWILDIVVVEPILSIPDNPGSRVVGVKPLESATIEVDPVSFTENLVVIEPGEWNLSLAENTQYRFLAKAPGYLSQDESFSTIGMKKVDGAADQRFELEIQLNKIYAGREIVLDDIYYDFDKSDIRSDAEPTLRELARDLQLNPELRIRLGSHTDCRGGDAYNRALSQRRAESAVQFLIDQGIDASRLEAVGFGEDVARTDCACSRCTEEDHQLNRRTTFAILE